MFVGDKGGNKAFIFGFDLVFVLAFDPVVEAISGLVGILEKLLSLIVLFSEVLFFVIRSNSPPASDFFSCSCLAAISCIFLVIMLFIIEEPLGDRPPRSRLLFDSFSELLSALKLESDE